ncbi:hypothetical protein [Lysobacter gummosus]|uniref:hypothetical protein n=1 Tax=Lysobacter gummosus TaxID=262324 RepID=UPI0036323800
MPGASRSMRTCRPPSPVVAFAVSTKSVAILVQRHDRRDRIHQKGRKHELTYQSLGRAHGHRRRGAGAISRGTGMDYAAPGGLRRPPQRVVQLQSHRKERHGHRRRRQCLHRWIPQCRPGHGLDRQQDRSLRRGGVAGEQSRPGTALRLRLCRGRRSER